MSITEKNGVFFTEKGECAWVKVNHQINTYKGKETGYQIEVKFDKKFEEEMIKLVAQKFEEGKKLPEFTERKDKKDKPIVLEWRQKPRVPYFEDDNGQIWFRFKVSHFDKDGNKRTVSIYDAEGNLINPKIGNGSIVKVKFAPRVYWIDDGNNGVKFSLMGIQVIDLKSFGGGVPGGGFDKEEGYVAAPFGEEEEVPI